MKTQETYWWYAIAAALTTVLALAAFGLIIWYRLDAAQKVALHAILSTNFIFIFMSATVLTVAVCLTLEWFFRFYIIPVNRVADEIDLIDTVNPDHRIHREGSYDVKRLILAINRSAERHSAFLHDVEQQLQSAQAEIKAEKNILATLLENVPHGILVCNLDGGIVFFNRRVKLLLTEHNLISAECETPECAWIGIGRSVYGFIDKELIGLALERITRKFNRRDDNSLSERFMLATRTRGFLPAEILPVLDSRHQLTAFIIYIEADSERMRKEKELSAKMQNWFHEMIQSVSVVKAISEILEEDSIKSDEDRLKLISVLCEHTEQAAELMSQRDITEWSPRQPFPLTLIDASEWTEFLFGRIFKICGIEFGLESDGMKAQISIDVHHLTAALISLFEALKEKACIATPRGRLSCKDDWVYLDLFWQGEAVPDAVLAELKQRMPDRSPNRTVIGLNDILSFHGAKLWTKHRNLPEGFTGLRLLIPFAGKSDSASVGGHLTILPDSRPEFYDFNLFQQSGQTPELDQRLLTELTYTVFDTETTGLNPQDGDEIISIGALRIVNCRLLRNDTFDQLVDPRRPLPWSSVKYHGIEPEMLKNQPFIEQVLPRFYEFARGTILVGHNAAFDLRMLQVKEAQSGVVFNNPVLDTMLLSTVVHPSHREHSLNAIAERLGVEIIGRHKALGDAAATGEIFLKMLPLLDHLGIRNLQQARLACQKSYFTRLKY